MTTAANTEQQRSGSSMTIHIRFDRKGFAASITEDEVREFNGILRQIQDSGEVIADKDILAHPLMEDLMRRMGERFNKFIRINSKLHL